MGNDEEGFTDDLIAVIDDIEIERAGRIDVSMRGAAAAAFEILEKFQQFARRHFIGIHINLSDGVEEFGGAGRAIDRGGVDAAGLPDLVDDGEGLEVGDAGVQFGITVAEIGTEGDAYLDEHKPKVDRTDPSTSSG